MESYTSASKMVKIGVLVSSVHEQFRKFFITSMVRGRLTTSQLVLLPYVNTKIRNKTIHLVQFRNVSLFL